MARTIDASAVRRVAHLARLRVTNDEIELYARQLSRVLDHMALLDQLDTTDVPPMAHTLSIVNVTRRDEPRTPLTPEEALHNAPQQRDCFIQVPKVLDQESK